MFRVTWIDIQTGLETFAVWIHCFITICLGMISLVFLTLLSLYYPLIRYFVVPYYIFIIYEYFFVIQNGGRSRTDWFISLYYWKLLIRYFQLNVITSTSLNPNKNYLICGHPHGQWCVGVVVGITGNIHTTKIFPNHKFYLATTRYNTCIPIQREYLLNTGAILASEKGITNVLENGQGKCVTLLVGGAREAFYIEYGKEKARALSHSGFCRIALKCGSPLLPFYVFGESYTVKRVYLEGYWKKITDLLINLVFNVCGGASVTAVGDYYILPYTPIPSRTPITVVYGRPIEVDKVEKPSTEQIMALREKYLNEIAYIYDTYKSKYSKNPNEKLVFEK